MKEIFMRTIILLSGVALLAACDDKGTRDVDGIDEAGQTIVGAAQGEMPQPGENPHQGCEELPNAEELKALLQKAPDEAQIGGLFGGRMEWGAIVNRAGELCAVAVSSDDPAAAWPGSLAIAKAKAFTANAFSTDEQPLSTARLYTMSQPGHSLWGAGAGNPMDPACIESLREKFVAGKVCGGTIVFGGGVPLYRNKTRVGGLGVSGDTPCADHEIAKRIRNTLQLNPLKGAYVDDIQYSSVDKPSIYTHPLCPNTWRNGEKIGEEPPASGY
jgi:uncharacterized protein GlcG (DUF336 family)